MKATEILKIYENLKEERSHYEPLWKECEKDASAILQNWNDENPTPGYELPRRVTNLPTGCINTCVTGIAGYAVSPNIPWFKLGLTDRETQEADGVAQWLEQCERRMRRVFERCGLYQNTIKWLEQGALYGQGVMLIEETRNADNPVRYYVPEIQELYLDNDEVGETSIVFRSYWTDIENAVNYYGRANMHENILRQYDDISGDGERLIPYSSRAMKLIHAVMLRNTGEPDTEAVGQNKKWLSITVDVQNKHIIKESGYDEFPYAVFYWEKSGKPYGISPTMKARNDIILYQEAMEETLKVAQLAANSPKIVNEVYRGKENFQPGGINYVRSADMAPTQLDVGANFPITIQITEMLAKNVRDWYNVDFFLMLRQQKSIQNMTATAIQAMQGEQAALLAALVANLFDGLSRIIQRTFNIMAKRGLLPKLPYAIQMRGGSLKTDFQGVLANAQKAAYEMSGITDVFSLAGQMAQFGKTDEEWLKALYWIKPDVLLRKAIESRGAPMELIRTQEEYDAVVGAIEQKQAAAQQAQAQATETQALIQNAKNLSEPVNPESPLAALLGRST
jgi:hypothetical protein